MFNINLDTDNAAFDSEDGGAQEVARILREVANRLDNGTYEGSLHDINGNRVGSFTYEGRPADDDSDKDDCPNGHGCGAAHAAWMDCP